MNACDKKLKSALVEAMRLDNARLEEELQCDEPHVFSPAFERRMEKLIRVQRSKNLIRSCFRYVAAAVLVLFLTGGILFIGSDDLNASALSIDILEWLDEFFTFEKDTLIKQEVSVLFDESQIGYMIEGFVKVKEVVSFSHVYYKYENESGDTIVLKVSNSLSAMAIDSEDIIKNVLISEQGREYTRIYKESTGYVVLMWQDYNGMFYHLESSLDNDELIKIMDNISYGK